MPRYGVHRNWSDQTPQRAGAGFSPPSERAQARAREQAQRAEDPRYGQCGRCELYVRRKADGTLVGHRAGRRPNDWLCPGDTVAE